MTSCFIQHYLKQPYELSNLIVMSIQDRARQLTVKGFSLIELLIVLAISAIFVVMAVPNIRQIMLLNQLEAKENEFLNIVKSMRNEAIKRGLPITLAPINSAPDVSNEWGDGLRAWIDVDGDNAYDSTEELIQQFAAINGVSVNANPNFSVISFRPTGRVGEISGRSTYSFDLCAAGRSEGATFLLASYDSKLQRSVKADCSKI
jgi:type IV fimbrial biogenesis protein FimT